MKKQKNHVRRQKTARINNYTLKRTRFFSDFLFGTNGLVENIWLGLKNVSNYFKWIDGSTLEFDDWANGSPNKEPNHDCLQMVADIHPKGKWVDEPRIKKNIGICQKPL